MRRGVIEQQPPYIIKDRSKLGTIFDFNRIRVDNPVAVIANELEPLTTLQKKIRRVCRTPGFFLRRNIVRYVSRKAEKAFEEDYRTYYIQGESKPKHIGRPMLIRGRSRRVGVVLCHGYMAAPAEVRGLADFLGRCGYWVYTPRLLGHGTAPEDLARCTYQDWIRSMEEGFVLVSNLCRKVVLGGFSTGAALALELASRIEGVSGVFAVATPLRLQYMASRLAPVVDTWNRLMGRVHLDEAKMIFVENHPEHSHINYGRNPISGVRELERLMDHLEPRLFDVKVPALIVQSKDDPVVNPKGSEFLFQQLGSRDKQYLMVNFQRHGILLGNGSQRVYGAIAQFIRQLFSDPLRAQMTTEKTTEGVSA